MHPLRFAKEHPVAVVTNMALGMIVGPWVLNMVRSTTGVGINLPRYSGVSE
jgi:hypothetical protein